ncbi:MAG: hypothetical protein HPM95_13480 [Alphaproteobacteria bacterium]|nr:hypothetical protein [Alphaproteobacteria bacterium]
MALLAGAAWLMAGLALPAKAETFGDWQLTCPTRDDCTLSTGALDDAGGPQGPGGPRLAFGAGEGASLSLAFEAPDRARTTGAPSNGRSTDD